jgi:hypothetical protein
MSTKPDASLCVNRSLKVCSLKNGVSIISISIARGTPSSIHFSQPHLARGGRTFAQFLKIHVQKIPVL